MSREYRNLTLILYIGVIGFVIVTLYIGNLHFQGKNDDKLYELRRRSFEPSDLGQNLENKLPLSENGFIVVNMDESFDHTNNKNGNLGHGVDSKGNEKDVVYENVGNSLEGDMKHPDNNVDNDNTLADEDKETLSDKDEHLEKRNKYVEDNVHNPNDGKNSIDRANGNQNDNNLDNVHNRQANLDSDYDRPENGLDTLVQNAEEKFDKDTFQLNDKRPDDNYADNLEPEVDPAEVNLVKKPVAFIRGKSLNQRVSQSKLENSKETNRSVDKQVSRTLEKSVKPLPGDKIEQNFNHKHRQEVKNTIRGEERVFVNSKSWKAKLPDGVAKVDLKARPSEFRPFPPLYQPVIDIGVKINCTKVWLGDVRETTRAKLPLNGYTAPVQPAKRKPGYYDHIGSHCEQYRNETQFVMTVSREEREFPLAFSIMVYKEVEQFERLLRAVYRPHNAYCVHMDLKTKPQDLAQMRAIISCLPNVWESPQRVDVVWGKFTVLEPELICMRALWQKSTSWRYLINLTGQEFPLKTNKELVAILQVYRGANDIQGDVPRVQNQWRWGLAHAPPPHNITVAKGPVHIAASRGFVNFLLHSRQASDFLEWVKKTGIPDETFFSTLNNMHQFGVPGSYTGNLNTKKRTMINRFKIWDSSNNSCDGKFIRNICHFGPRDVHTLTLRRNLVANKFSYELFPLALDCTEQWYFHKVRKEDVTGGVDYKRLHLDYYANLQIVRNAYREQNGPWT